MCSAVIHTCWFDPTQLEEALDCTLAVDVHSYSHEHNMPTLSGHVSVFVLCYKSLAPCALLQYD